MDVSALTMTLRNRFPHVWRVANRLRHESARGAWSIRTSSADTWVLDRVLCQRFDIGSCATGSASDLPSLFGVKSTGRASGTLLCGRDKALANYLDSVTHGSFSARGRRQPSSREASFSRTNSRRHYVGVRNRSLRGGFTMVEMLLVLGVIVAFAGMTVPPVMRMFSQQKLTGSAERVRAAIAAARFRAIESGLIYQFCCETNGTRFVVVPFEPDHGSGQTGGQMSGRASGQLPKGIVFSSTNIRTLANSATPGTSTVSSTPVATSSHKLPPGSLDGLPNAGDLASANWGLPILFHPEGSANADIEITVSDAKLQQIKLHVRAFTGAVTMERLVAGKR